MTLRDQLRSLPSIVGNPPNGLTASDHPRDTLVEWIQRAIDDQIPEPHAVTLSTVDDQGNPDARVLIIKNVDEEGSVEIATSGHSAKGLQVASNPFVAITWYCSPHARSIRIRGRAELADPVTIANDFRSRGVRAKAIALSGQQSTPTRGDRNARITEQEEVIRSCPEIVSDDWQVWRIVPDEVEFWQGAKDRNHERLKYRRGKGGTWTVTELWP